MQEELETNLRQAFARLTKASSDKARQAHHEQEYGQAYQALVRIGARPQVPARMRKYRYSPGHARG